MIEKVNMYHPDKVADRKARASSFAYIMLEYYKEHKKQLIK